jgi:cytochrome c-type biogenesis protein CcmH/NrfG
VRLLLIVTCMVCAMLMGCATTFPAGASGLPPTSRRDTPKAQRLTREAEALITTDPGRAIILLHAAIAADPLDGPARYGLGRCYLGLGMPYEAAGELEWARRLMPGHPGPEDALDRALERATDGQTDPHAAHP